MFAMRSLLIGALLSLLAAAASADVRNCACDPKRPETLEARECSLCKEAEKQPPDVEVFLLKDISPRKPNRWLALPRIHVEGPHSLHDLPKELQTKLWKLAIEKARELWGEGWGLAYNSEHVRTQCHTHIHIGKLLLGLAPGKYYDVDRPEQIRAPEDGTGIWVHPVGNKLRVHYGEHITETTLLR
jgi:diadenosine tetraphosphate (Ap4A) HIT family hydrolase